MGSSRTTRTVLGAIGRGRKESVRWQRVRQDFELEEEQGHMIPMAGERFGPYEILGTLGRGGVGEVYRAWDGRLEREVAIKLLHDDYPQPGARERFMIEARAASALSHPNICTIYDIGEKDGAPYLVMELLRGETLKHRIERGGMAAEEIARFGSEIAEALGAAHAMGIVHRDVKPANIMLVPQPDGRMRVKVLDFGLAKIKGTLPGGLHHDEHLTVPGEAVGTVSYMSPEQARGDELDGRSDLFSLGTVLYEMATRRTPFHGSTTPLLFVQLLNENPEPIRDWNEEVPRWLDKVIMRLLEKEPGRRFQTAVEAAGALISAGGKASGQRWRRAVAPPVPLVRVEEPVARAGLPLRPELRRDGVAAAVVRPVRESGVRESNSLRGSKGSAGLGSGGLGSGLRRGSSGEGEAIRPIRLATEETARPVGDVTPAPFEAVEQRASDAGWVAAGDSASGEAAVADAAVFEEARLAVAPEPVAVSEAAAGEGEFARLMTRTDVLSRGIEEVRGEVPVVAPEAVEAEPEPLATPQESALEYAAPEVDAHAPDADVSLVNADSAVMEEDARAPEPEAAEPVNAVEAELEVPATAEVAPVHEAVADVEVQGEMEAREPESAVEDEGAYEVEGKDEYEAGDEFQDGNELEEVGHEPEEGAAELDGWESEEVDRESEPVSAEVAADDEMAAPDSGFGSGVQPIVVQGFVEAPRAVGRKAAAGMPAGTDEDESDDALRMVVPPARPGATVRRVEEPAAHVEAFDDTAQEPVYRASEETTRDLFLSTITLVAPNRSRRRKRRATWAAAAVVLVSAGAGLARYVGHRGIAVLRPGERVAIAGIENHTGAQMLDGSVAAALEFALAQNPKLAVVDGESYGAALHPLTADERPLDPVIARQAAQAAGADAYLYGEVGDAEDGVHGSGAGYRVAVVLRDTAGDREIARAESRADRMEDIPGAIDSIAMSLMKDFGSAKTGYVPLAKEATGNLSALRLYAVGMQAAAEGREEAALKAYSSAVMNDRGFVQALVRISWLAREEHAAKASADAAEKARAAAEGRSARTMLLARSAAEANSQDDLEAAAAGAETLLAHNERDEAAKLLLARVKRLRGDYEDAEKTAEQGIAESPTSGAMYTEAELALVGMNRAEQAATLVEKATGAGLSRPAFRVVTDYLAGRPEAADAGANEPGLLAERGVFLDNTGDLGDGEESWIRAAEAIRGQAGLSGGAGALLARAALNRALAGSCESALRLGRGVGLGSTRETDTAVRVGVAAGLCGDEELAQAAESVLSGSAGRLGEVRTAVALGRGDEEQAAREAKEISGQDPILLGTYLKGLVHLYGGQAPAGIAELQDVLAHRGVVVMAGTNLYPMAQLAVARAFAESGDRGNSVAAYGQFLRLWDGAGSSDRLKVEAVDAQHGTLPARMLLARVEAPVDAREAGESVRRTEAARPATVQAAVVRRRKEPLLNGLPESWFQHPAPGQVATGGTGTGAVGVQDGSLQ